MNRGLLDRLECSGATADAQINIPQGHRQPSRSAVVNKAESVISFDNNPAAMSSGSMNGLIIMISPAPIESPVVKILMRKRKRETVKAIKITADDCLLLMFILDAFSISVLVIGRR